MISIFGVNAKKYSDMPLTYAPATGFKWAIVTLYIKSSDTAMTVYLNYIKNGNSFATLLTTTTSMYLDAQNSAGRIRYADLVISSLDGLQISQTGGVTGDAVTAIIEVEVFPA